MFECRGVVDRIAGREREISARPAAQLTDIAALHSAFAVWLADSGRDPSHPTVASTECTAAELGPALGLSVNRARFSDWSVLPVAAAAGDRCDGSGRSRTPPAVGGPGLSAVGSR